MASRFLLSSSGWLCDDDDRRRLEGPCRWGVGVLVGIIGDDVSLRNEYFTYLIMDTY